MTPSSGNSSPGTSPAGVTSSATNDVVPSNDTSIRQEPFPQHRRIVVLTDGYSTPFVAKTAISLLRYRTDDIVGVIDKSADVATAQKLLGAGGDIPVIADIGLSNNADALYVGIAPPGGRLPDEWRSIICDALRRRMDVVSGLHDFLTDDDEYRQLATDNGVRLIDVRRNRFKSTAQCRPFRAGCIRIHSVGQDCSVGKMVTTIEVERGLIAAGHDARFLATGQTGIMISGDGVPIDCVVSDFVNGAAEQLVQRNEQHDFLLIEGQGSISHPSFSAVTLGLLHGCAPDGLIYCYEAGREQVKGLDNVDIPPLKTQLAVYEAVAGLRHPCKVIGIAVNTRSLDDAAARAEIDRAAIEFGLPVCDVYRTGSDKLVQAAIALRTEVLAR